MDVLLLLLKDGLLDFLKERWFDDEVRTKPSAVAVAAAKWSRVPTNPLKWSPACTPHLGYGPGGADQTLCGCSSSREVVQGVGDPQFAGENL